MLKLGKSKPWQYALEQMTGNREKSVAPMKEYFQPLQDWLVKERCSKKYNIGWPEQPADDVEECPKRPRIYYAKYRQRWRPYYRYHTAHKYRFKWWFTR